MYYQEVLLDQLVDMLDGVHARLCVLNGGEWNGSDERTFRLTLVLLSSFDNLSA